MSERIIPVIDLVNADGTNALFGTKKTRYVVPVYQRAFAWGSDNSAKKQNEIVQLMDDVLAAKGTYYLGSLVVSKCHDGPYDYEVIDGQQRLTALYIIFACLGFKVNEGSLGYACREESLALLRRLAAGDVSGCLSCEGNAGNENEQSGIRRGVRIVLEEFQSKCGAQSVEEYKQRLRDAFKQVKLFRIEVPEGTDLNRYFEIMNTRGEQLEQQDIVKADLLSRLESNQQRVVFAEIWDACSDMDGYVQMHFSGEHEKKGNESRRELMFGKDWNECLNIE